MIFPCCCGCVPAPTSVPLFENRTRVVDYSAAANPAGILPYGRPWRVCDAGDGSCDSAEFEGDCGAATDLMACYDRSFDKTLPTNEREPGGVLCDMTGAGLVSNIIQNCYVHTGAMQSFPSTCTYGWKGVQAVKQWPGRFGFINSGCCDTEDETSGLVQSKYTGISHFETTSSTMTDTGSFGSYTLTHSATWNQTASVDAHGNVNRSGSRSSYFTDSRNSPPTETDDCQGSVVGGWTITGFPYFFAVAVSGNVSADCGIINYNGTFGTAEELNAMEINAPSPGVSTPFEEATITGGPLVFTLTDNWLTITQTLSGTRILKDGNGDVVRTTTASASYSCTIALSGTYTYETVCAECQVLLGEWNMTDDRIYPWRTDAATWLQPLVTRDEAGTVPTIDWSQPNAPTDCAFANSGNYTGEIQGSPLPPGYARYFNFNHIDWCAAQPPGGNCGACERYKGMMSIEPIPVAATQWTQNARGSSEYGPGAHVSQCYDGQFGFDPHRSPYEGVRMQKWAETLEQWPSVNYSRPCARDRYLFDESAVACIIDFDGVDLEIDTFPSVTFTVGDVVATPLGVFQIASGSGTTYTVGAMKYDALVECQGISKLRFASARAICSTLVCSAVQTSPGLITVTCEDKHWLKANGTDKDTLTFTGIGGLTTALATVVSDNTFTVAGTLTGTESPVFGTVSHGATSAQIAFDTTCSRGDFYTRESASRYREAHLDPEEPSTVVTETARNLPRVARRPTVVCISPNNEGSHPGWTNLSQAFFSTLADQCFGTEKHYEVIQVAIDPFWQVPHRPCDLEFPDTWTQADQPCGGDETHWDYPPLVEPRLTVPSGAPEMTAVTLHTVGGMPGAVSHPNCEIEPYGRATAHYVREAWLTCDEWKELVNFKC